MSRLGQNGDVDVEDQFLSMQDVADRYGVKLQTVRGWRMTGYGPRGFKVGNLVRYPLTECQRWEAEQMSLETA